MSEKTSRNLEDERLDDYSYTTQTLGIWRLLLPRESFSAKILLYPGLSMPWDKWNENFSFVPVIWRFLKEIYLLSPGLVLLFSVLGLGAGMEQASILYASTKLLKTVILADSCFVAHSNSTYLRLKLASFKDAPMPLRF
jgi:hypothetical protein